tara:strand:+ start:2802 stop:3263 length:462 start_codon:yes stop_codon:yes gene_type:complete
MPCHVAIDKKSAVVGPDVTVEAALEKIRKENLSGIAVQDEQGELIGLFTAKTLLGNIIPVSIAMSDGIQIDVKIEAAPGVAKRLRKMYPLSITEGMERKFDTVGTDAPIWEGVTKITKYGGPLAVLDSKGKFKGLITSESLVKALENTEEMDA